MKNTVLLWFVSLCSVSLLGQQNGEVLSYFPLQEVRLLESPFKRAQDNNVRYLLELDADRLLSPFLREAGLEPKAPSYTNWENTGLDGHIGGHYLSGLSLLYASTADARIAERLEYMISELKRVQDAHGDGYIGGVPGGKAMWQEIAAGNIRAASFDLNGKWVPLYNIHKAYAGLRDAWLYTGNETARQMLIDMTDWMLALTSKLSDEQLQKMLRSEHGSLNETFADVYELTGEKKYLELAHRFSHRAILDPLLESRDELTGKHANTQIPKVLGFKRIADLEGNEGWNRAADFFWKTVTQNRSVCTGGHSVSEIFNNPRDFSQMIHHIEGTETCNTYNMLRLTRMLYARKPAPEYMDYYERALYNHILSTQHPEQGGFVYFTQMRPGHYRVYSQPQTSMWCCVGSSLESHSKYAETIYAHTSNVFYVNLFIPSEANWKEKGVVVKQETAFPDEARTRLTVDVKKKTLFTMALRVPEWTTNAVVKINGKPVVVEVIDGYIQLARQWKKGDTVEMEMPMSLRAEQLPDHSDYYAFCYGPIVLAADVGREDLLGLFADDSRGGHVAHGRRIAMSNMPVVVSDPTRLLDLLQPVANKPLTFRLAGLYPEKYAGGLELIPFYRLYENRYIIYWPQATPEKLTEMLREREKEEREVIRLDSLTVDKVVCGQQQPESDHFIQYDNSEIGFSEDVHWREAEGWFSYQLKNKDKRAVSLQFNYLNFDSRRDCDVYINGKLIKNFQFNGRGKTKVFTQSLLIPEEEIQKDRIEIKFVRQSGRRTPKITEVRLLSQE